MNWCKEHWDQLRQAVEAAGLSQYISKDGFEAVKRLEGNQYDPLIDAWMRITVHMLESDGCQGRIFSCPCCILVEDGYPELVEDWMQGAVEDSMSDGVHHGYLPKQ